MNYTLELCKIIPTLVVACITAYIAFEQCKTARAKLKLDLYNKRFSIYESVLKLYQATWSKDYERMELLSFEFLKSFRESKFLFDKKDGSIYEILSKIQQNNAAILGYEELLYKEINGEVTDKDKKEALQKYALVNRAGFEKNLIDLEKEIDKYLYFKSINGT